MKKHFNFKSMYRTALVALCLITVGVGSAWGWANRTYDGSTKLYIMNMAPSGWSVSWASGDDNQLWVCLKPQTGSETWYTPTLESGSNKYARGALYSITPPSGTYEYVKLKRGSSKDGDGSNTTYGIDFNSTTSNNLLKGWNTSNSTGDWGEIHPSPVTSDGTGILYFNMAPGSNNSNIDYDFLATKNFAFFYNNDHGEWSDQAVQVTGNYYKVHVPQGTWSGVILTRHGDVSSPDWSNVYQTNDGKKNQSTDITFTDNHNYISAWYENKYAGVITATMSDYVPSSTYVLNGSMNGWNMLSAKYFDEGSLELSLPAHKTYSFKIIEGNGSSGTWKGLYDSNCIVSTMAKWGCSGSVNIPINTAGAGTYTFEYNTTDGLSVTYPTASHPSMDYVYLIDYSWSDPRIHFPSASSSGVSATNNGGQQLEVSGTSSITNTVTISDQQYFYAAVGEYSSLYFHKNGDNVNNSGLQTPVLSQRLYWDGSAWTWGAFEVHIALDDRGATTNVDPTYFDVDYNSTVLTNLTSIPLKDHYDFQGFYTNSDGTGTQVIDKDGHWIESVTGYTDASKHWIHPGCTTTVYAKWTEHEYSITMEVSPAGTGTTSPASTATGKLVTESGDIIATPAAGYKFKEWQFSKTGEDYDAWCADSYSSTDATIHIKAQHNGTLTAVFEERYSLVGSLYDGSEGGMPGWEDYSKTFTVNSSSPVDLTRTCTLQANKTYKLQVHDLATSTNLGRSGCDPVCVLEENASLVMENSNNDVFLYTSGAGEYIFKITAVDGSGHPTLTVLRPYPVNFGQKYQDIDGTLHAGTTGGTAAATAGGDALTSGDYVTYNTSVTHTATAESGYTFAGWWSSDAFEGDAFSDTNPMTYAVTSGDNTYAKFVETSTSVTLANDGNGKVQIGGEDATSTTCGVTTTRELTAVANAGYKFKNWTTSDSPDFEVDDADAATVTLTGHGAGTAGTLTANFTECWVLSAQSEGWGSATFTISNISDVSGDVVGYVDISLPANTDLQFKMVDNSTDTEYKNGTDKVYYMTYTNYTNWDFTTGKTYNCGITTAGKGTYRFTWNITDKTMTVTYPLSYQVNYGVFPSVGGSVTVVDDDSQSVPSGGYVRNGGSVTYTAAANIGFTFEGWYTDDTYKTQFSTESSWTNGTVTKTSNSYAKFNAVGLSFTGGEGGSGIYWNDASNWSPACVPTIYHDVTIPKYCEVGKYGSPVVATAKSIVIDTVGHAGARISVNAGYALAVEEMIKVKTSNTPTYGPTTENLLKLESNSSYEHAALAVKGYNKEQMDIVARVEFHTQSCVYNYAGLGGDYAGWYVNQFIGTPLRNPDIWDYYGCWIYKWDPTHHDEINDKYGDWVYQSSSTPLEPFRGYDILSEIEYPETYWLEGQLVYAQDTTLNLYYNANHVTDMGAELGQENMFANSWTAPIDVSQMTTSDFAGGDEDKMEATIYVFNSGWPNAWEELKDKIGTLPGQYLSMSVKSAEYTSSITCIPAMQAFSVFAKTAGASLTLDYDRIVYNPLLERSTAIEPMRAPRRARTELSNDDPEIMRIRVEGAQGADQMHLLLREDFHADFDNGWDARKMFGESYAPQIFAITEDGNMSVNCIPDAEGTVLGFRKGSDDSEYTFRFEYDGEETLYLNDLMTQTSTLIDAESTYTFNAAENDAEARFVISANPFNEPAVTTGWSEVGDGSKVHKLMINGVLYIIRGGRIYNINGALVK